MVSTNDGVTLAKALANLGGQPLNLSFATYGGFGQMLAIDAQSRLQVCGSLRVILEISNNVVMILSYFFLDKYCCVILLFLG